jgi:excisionase family DNA binding protein
MPRRDDSLEAYWLDPRLPALGEQPSTATREDTATMPNAAVLIISDKIGFHYERQVRLQDFVSEREAAKLLGVPVMTVHRWVKAGTLNGAKRRDYSVIRLADVLRIASERGLLDPERIRTKVPVGSPNEPNPFSGFASTLSSENIYVKFTRVDKKRPRSRGRDSSR